MRITIGGVVVLTAVLLPKGASAQAYHFQTPTPTVSAQSATWQINDEPIIVNGLVYYPTGERRFFDGQIMAQVSVYGGVPVYADVTLEPHSVIYVPVARLMMRGYERRREGDLAGTQGSRTPSFPVQPVSAIVPREAMPIGVPGIGAMNAPASQPERAPDVIQLTSIPRPAPMHIESARRPSGSNGIWLEFNGARWYSSGPAVAFSADRFTQIGDYHDFPVYQERSGTANQIWVRVVKGGPVAPYVRE